MTQTTTYRRGDRIRENRQMAPAETILRVLPDYTTDDDSRQGFVETDRGNTYHITKIRRA